MLFIILLLNLGNLNAQEFAINSWQKDWVQLPIERRINEHYVRAIFANFVAYKALKDHKKIFPAGSVFLKVDNKNNYFYMVKKKSWEYRAPSGDTTLCLACHGFAEKNDFVYSVTEKNVNKKPTVKTTFTKTSKENLPVELTQFLPKTKYVLKRLVLEKTIILEPFASKKNELVVTLAREAVKTQSSTFFLAEDNKTFCLVALDNPDNSCRSPLKVICQGAHSAYPVQTPLCLTN